jgi:hypothetical protein
MMLRIAFQILALLVPLMQSATTPLRIGVLGPQLTNEDVAALEMVFLPAKLWLLNGSRIQFGIGEWMQAFLPPTGQTEALRRGMVISVERWTPLTAWTVQRTESYAQVAIPGRKFDEIRDDHDINRPFRVIGQFEDMEIVRLVEFLRPNPTTRGRPVEVWPIGYIQRKPDGSVEVELMETASQGQVIRLRRSGQDWGIVEMGGWAA